MSSKEIPTHKNSIFGLILVLLCSHAFGEFGEPILNSGLPHGGQRGTSVEMTFRGKHLHHAEEILFYESGITASEIQPNEKGNSIKATFQISENAPLGEHPYRIRTKTGLTYMRTFWVGQFPTIEEATHPKDQKKDLNNSFDSAQDVNINHTIYGISRNEDVDYYRFQGKKGQRITLEVEGVRLGVQLFDPYIALLDENEVELISSDDTTLLKRDPFLSYVLPADGSYTILIRESAYQGNDRARYRLHLAKVPRPTALYPPAGKPGETLNLRFIGDAAGSFEQTVTLPKEETSVQIYAKPQGNAFVSPSGNPIRVSHLNYLNEVEPNETRNRATPLENPPTPPVAFHGILSTADDKDWFRFSAKKGQKLRARVYARQLRSPLDANIVVRKIEDGKGLGNNDDFQNKPDSRLDFEIPEDGVYVINIHDRLYAAGPDFTYRIEVTERPSTLSASVPYQRNNDSQYRQAISIPRGSQLAIVPNIQRENTGCDVEFITKSLPEGVHVDSDTMPRNVGNIPILFSAKKEAPLSGGLFEFEVKDPKSDLRGPLVQNINHVEINNAGIYHATRNQKIAIAVIEEAPFSISVEAPQVPIANNGTLALKVRINRKEGFQEKVRIELPWKPPGINGPTSVDIPGDQSEAIYELNANGDAPHRSWRLVLNAEATPKDKGTVRVSSTFFPLEVTSPYLKMTLPMAAMHPGESSTLTAKIEHLKPFEGEAKATLHGLPSGVTSEPQSFTKSTQELSFPITTTPEARIGKHTNLFVYAYIPLNDAEIAHNAASGGTLRIDKKAAPKSKKTLVAKTDAPRPTEKKKALTRLEQLRQEK